MLILRKSREYVGIKENENKNGMIHLSHNKYLGIKEDENKSGAIHLSQNFYLDFIHHEYLL